jgi:hypothetical protein
VVVDDVDGIAEDQADAMQKSVDAYRDAWQDGRVDEIPVGEGHTYPMAVVDGTIRITIRPA